MDPDADKSLTIVVKTVRLHGNIIQDLVNRMKTMEQRFDDYIKNQAEAQE